jgi:choice-of-anchor B domain-containing protein
VGSPPVTFANTAHYDDFGSAHNIAINEDSGFAYAIGTGTCSGGLHMVQNPASPTNAGCYSGDGYTHDTQCVIYNGPDADYQGAEVCFSSNEDTLTIVDVSNKAAPDLI